MDLQTDERMIKTKHIDALTHRKKEVMSVGENVVMAQFFSSRMKMGNDDLRMEGGSQLSPHSSRVNRGAIGDQKGIHCFRDNGGDDAGGHSNGG